MSSSSVSLWTPGAEPPKAWDEEALQNWIAGTPGLEGWAQDLLRENGVCTIEILAGLSDRTWKDVLSFIPMKRLDHPDDLWDDTRKGAGHLNSLDELRKRAKDLVSRRTFLSGGEHWVHAGQCMDGMFVEPGSPKNLHDVGYDGDDEIELAMSERDLELVMFQGFTGLN